MCFDVFCLLADVKMWSWPARLDGNWGSDWVGCQRAMTLSALSPWFSGPAPSVGHVIPEFKNICVKHETRNLFTSVFSYWIMWTPEHFCWVCIVCIKPATLVKTSGEILFPEGMPNDSLWNSMVFLGLSFSVNIFNHFSTIFPIESLSLAGKISAMPSTSRSRPKRSVARRETTDANGGFESQ